MNLFVIICKIEAEMHIISTVILQLYVITCDTVQDLANGGVLVQT